MNLSAICVIWDRCFERLTVEPIMCGVVRKQYGQKTCSCNVRTEAIVERGRRRDCCQELCTRMARDGYEVTCFNRGGHHVSGAEYDQAVEYKGVRQKTVPTIDAKGLAAVSSSGFAALCSAFGRYDVVHIHAEGPAFFAWLPKRLGKESGGDDPWFGLGPREMAIRTWF